MNNRFIVILLIVLACNRPGLLSGQSPDRSTAVASASVSGDYVPVTGDHASVSGNHWIIATNQASNKIEIYDPAIADWNSAAALKNSWYPNASNGFVEHTAGWSNASDARLRRIGSRQYLLVACSGGFCAAIPYPSLTGKLWADFVGSHANPHAIELLPDGNVAIAASSGGWVRVYTASQDTNADKYVAFPLGEAHAVLWDPGIGRLWTLGDLKGVGAVLTALIIGGTVAAPTLIEDSSRRVHIPGSGGHDLDPYYGDTNKLWVTMNVDLSGSGGVYIFDKTTRLFTPASGDANRPAVKAVSNQLSGQIVETTPDHACALNSWSTPTVDFYAPRDRRTVKGACFYKARICWWAYQ